MSERRHLVAALALALAGSPGCVLHTAGLTVDLALSLPAPSAVRAPRLTDLALLACPGTGQALHHTHDAPAWDLALAGEETVSLAVRPGRYCDLRLQLEAEGAVPRQAVVPLLCGGEGGGEGRGERAELVLDASALEAAPPRIEVRATAAPSPPPDDPLAAQRAMDALVRSITATLACAPP